MEDPSGTDRNGDRSGLDTRTRHDQRHVHRRLIEQVTMLELAVVAESFSVVARDHDR